MCKSYPHLQILNILEYNILMTKKLDKKLLDYFKAIGRKGGTTTAKNMTKKQRVERAKKAINTRWAKKH